MKFLSGILAVFAVIGLTLTFAKARGDKNVTQTQQFISMMKVGRPDLQNDFFGHLTSEETAAFLQHGAYLTKQFNAGKIIFAGPSVEEKEEHFAIVVLNTKDKAEAESIMNADPAVTIGILTSHVTQFQVFLARDFKP